MARLSRDAGGSMNVEEVLSAEQAAVARRCCAGRGWVGLCSISQGMSSLACSHARQPLFTSPSPLLNALPPQRVAEVEAPAVHT